MKKSTKPLSLKFLARIQKKSQDLKTSLRIPRMKVCGFGFRCQNCIQKFPVAQEKEGIEDRTETNLVNLRRIIYLTIMNALNYEEAVHKLLKVQLQEGEEVRGGHLSMIRRSNL